MPRSDTLNVYRKRKYRQTGINLDSLTDILANTVGIVIFLMIFAVISARGSFYAKSFPMLQDTSKERVVVLCQANTLMIIRADIVIDQFLQPLYEFNQRSSGRRYSAIPDLIDEFNERRMDDGVLEATGEAEMSSWSIGWSYYRKIDRITVIVQPLPGISGEYPEDIQNENSLFRRSLGVLDSNSQFLMFFVDTDSIDAFRAGRDIAQELGFDTNWIPNPRLFWPLRYNVPFDGDSVDSGQSITDFLFRTIQ